MKQTLLLFPLLLLLTLPARAAETDAFRRDTLDLEGVEGAAGGYMDGFTAEDMDLDGGLAGVLEQGGEALPGALRQGVRSCALLLAAVLLSSLAGGLTAGAGETALPVVPLAGALAVAAVAVGDVRTLLGLGTETLETMTGFANVLLPTAAVLTAATGAIAGAAARQMAAALFSGLLMNLISKLLVPLLYAYLAASVGHAALGNEALKRVAGMLKWAVTSILTAVLLVFVGYLTVSGVVAGSADAARVKAARFAISGAVPVVGGILSDAADTVLASAGVLRGAVGAYGAVAVLMMCVVPFLRLGAQYLAYKFTAAIAASVADGPTAGLIDAIGGAFGLILGMTGAMALLQLVALVSCLTAASV